MHDKYTPNRNRIAQTVNTNLGKGLTCDEDLEVLRLAKEAKEVKMASKKKALEDKVRRLDERRLADSRSLHEARTLLFRGDNDRSKVKLLVKHYTQLLIKMNKKDEMQGLRKEALSDLYWDNHVDINEDPGPLPPHLVEPDAIPSVPTGGILYCMSALSVHTFYLYISHMYILIIHTTMHLLVLIYIIKSNAFMY